MAVAFDAERLAVTGVPIPVLEGINVKFNGTASFSLSASGSLVYVSGTQAFGAPRIAVWVSRDGEEEESLPLPPQQYFYPRLSPDVTRLAASVEEGPAGLQVWVFDVASAAPVRLTAQGRNHVPVWMSDSLLAFTSDEEDGRARLHSVMADGNAEPQPLSSAMDEIGSDFPRSITPDGRYLIFTRSRSADRAILRLPFLGDALPEPLLQGEFLRGGAEVSPDGRWLAYRSNQTRQLEVYVQPYPRGGSAVRAPIGSVGVGGHVWSPDGSELIYRIGDRMMAMPFTADGNTPRFGQPTELFQGDYMMALPSAPRMYDVAPDGRFLMLKYVTPSSQRDDLGPQVVLVQNWLDELRELVPN
jgi:Tol biopolymer transport system component